MERYVGFGRNRKISYKGEVSNLVCKFVNYFKEYVEGGKNIINHRDKRSYG